VASRSGEEGRQSHLAACTIYRDAAEYLPEWIEFHRLVGVERFFLYDNGSRDDHERVLAPYVAEGIAIVHRWPHAFLGHNGRPRAIFTAFEDCCGRYAREARWIAFLDVDEFLFSPTGASLPDVLQGYEEFPGVVVSRADFGPSGHQTKPEGLVIESYLQRRALRPDDEVEHKSVVHPSGVVRFLSAHSFVHRDGQPVNEDRRRVDTRKRITHSPVAWSRLRVHHYWSRSEEERRRKAELWRAVGSIRGLPNAPVAEQSHPVRDETLAAYAPAVRAALASRGYARP